MQEYHQHKVEPFHYCMYEYIALLHAYTLHIKQNVFSSQEAQSSEDNWMQWVLTSGLRPCRDICVVSRKSPKSLLLKS